MQSPSSTDEFSDSMISIRNKHNEACAGIELSTFNI